MIALLVVLAIFGAFWLYGLAFLSAVRADLSQLRVVLTAPLIGSVIPALVLFILSFAGMHMRTAGRPVAIALAVVSVAVLAVRRPRIPATVAAVLVVCLCNLVLIGRPMLQFGLNWVGNANADMAAYVLSATQLLDHGLIAPEASTWVQTSRDYAGSAQFAHNEGARPGADITIAGLSAATGVRPQNIYMALILALNLTTLCAAAALAMQAARRWWAAPLAAGVLTVAPFANFGVLQQLLPQTWGLGLAAALFAWLMREEVHRRPGPKIADLAVISLLVTTFVIIYIELAASLVLAYALYVLVLLLRRRIAVRPTLLLWGVSLLAVLLVHRQYLLHEFGYVRGQATNGLAPGGGTTGRWAPLFGYTLVPAALPGMFGLQLLPASPTARLLAVSIVVALIVLVVVFVYAVRATRHGVAAATVLLADAAFALLLAVHKSDFGLYKMYMYVQPFLAATLAVWISSIRRREILGAVAVLLALVGAVSVRNSNIYVDRSRDPIDLHDASSSTLIPYFAKIVEGTRKPVITVTDNLVTGGLEAARVGHRQLFFISRAFWGEQPAWSRRYFRYSEHGIRRSDAFRFNERAARLVDGKRCLTLLPTGDQSIVNRLEMPEGSGREIAVERCRHYPQNTLLFISSHLGQGFYLPADRRRVSIYQLEHDPMFKGHTFSGFGRYALFKVLNPTRKVRLVIDFTNTFNQDGSNVLPPAAVFGATRGRFDVVGRGSARVVSQPVRPQMIDGSAFVLLDMGRPGRLPPHPRTGVKALYGRHVPLDGRYLTSWVRDISLVSDRRLRRFPAPSGIASFPSGLGDPGLQYSGVFEDGWLSERSWVRLAAGPEARLTIRADVPPTGRRQHLQVRVDRRLVYSHTVAAGFIATSILVPASSTPRRVDLRWSAQRQLGPHDRRHASALLRSIGISTSFGRAARFPLRRGEEPAASSGIEPDGWAERRSEIVLAGGGAGDLTIEGSAPQDNHLTVLVNGKSVLSRAVKAGELSIRVGLHATARPRRIVLRWAKSARIGGGDPRVAAALLRSVAFASAGSASSSRGQHSGIWADGWMERTALLKLRPGPTGVLDLRFEVVVPHQRLELIVDGRAVRVGQVATGPVRLSVPIGSSRTARHVELRWAATAPIAPNDPRVAAALLESARVGSLRATDSVTLSSIQKGTTPSIGIFGDGWMQRDVRVLLHGGAAGVLSLRALDAVQGQRLAVVVNGRPVKTTGVRPGELRLRIGIPASRAARLVELHWSRSARIGPNDPRTAAALLHSISVSGAQQR